MTQHPKIISRAVAFKTPWFELLTKDLEDAASTEPQRYYMIHGADYVNVLAITQSGYVPLVQQYRATVETLTLEFPSGHIENGEEPAAAAARELKEETGFQAEAVELLGTLSPDTGRLSNRMWSYLCPHISDQKIQDWKPEPGISVHLYSQNEILDLVRTGKFYHALDLATLSLALTHNVWKSA